jgi:hypothetical protein
LQFFTKRDINRQRANLEIEFSYKGDFRVADDEKNDAKNDFFFQLQVLTFLAGKEDVPGEHGGDTWNLFLLVHGFIAWHAGLET